MVIDGVKVIIGFFYFEVVNVVGVVVVLFNVNVLMFLNNIVIVGGNVFVLGLIF